MRQDGYIKFKCDWTKSDPLPPQKIRKLNDWRRRLYRLGLLGVYENGIGYGNVSVRDNMEGQFIITGTQTGSLSVLTEQHYTLVYHFDLDRNILSCEGPIEASSESLTHAVLYQISPEINAVIHVHQKTLWRKLLNRVPTTSEKAAYGTPEMAREVERLFKHSKVAEKGIFVMGGHEEGIVTFGKSLQEAGKVLLEHLGKS